MAIKTGKTGSVYSIDSTTVFTTEAMTEDGATMIYQIDDVAMRVWDINTELEISAGVELDKSYYNDGINYFEGKVKLTTTGETITASGSYLTLAEVDKCFGWALSMSLETEKQTLLGDTWDSFLTLGKSATVSISRFRDDVLFDNADDDTSLFLLKLYEDATYGYICNAIKTSLSQTKAVGALDQEATSFTATSNIARF